MKWAKLNLKLERHNTDASLIKNIGDQSSSKYNAMKKGNDDDDDKDNYQVNFFVTDSVIPEPAKTTLIILYCLLITIAGDHHVMTRVMLMTS